MPAHSASVLPPAPAAPRAGAVSLGLSFDQVEKRFGPLSVLRNVTFQVAAGEFAILLGANGSGKTTLLRLAALLAQPTRGTVRWEGIPAGLGPQGNDCAGYLGHLSQLYDELTALENLQFFARLYRLPFSAEELRTRLASAGLDSWGGTLVRAFSRGMRQRLALVRVFLHSPSLLLLDEPSAGLDTPGIDWLAGILTGLRDSACTVLMSTHGDSPLTAFASRVMWLAGGKLAGDAQADIPSALRQADIAIRQDRGGVR